MLLLLFLFNIFNYTATKAVLTTEETSRLENWIKKQQTKEIQPCLLRYKVEVFHAPKTLDNINREAEKIASRQSKKVDKELIVQSLISSNLALTNRITDLQILIKQDLTIFVTRYSDTYSTPGIEEVAPYDLGVIIKQIEPTKFVTCRITPLGKDITIRRGITMSKPECIDGAYLSPVAIDGIINCMGEFVEQEIRLKTELALAASNRKPEKGKWRLDSVSRQAEKFSLLLIPPQDIPGFLNNIEVRFNNKQNGIEYGGETWNFIDGTKKEVIVGDIIEVNQGKFRVPQNYEIAEFSSDGQLVKRLHFKLIAVHPTIPSSLKEYPSNFARWGLGEFIENNLNIGNVINNYLKNGYNLDDRELIAVKELGVDKNLTKIYCPR